MLIPNYPSIAKFQALVELKDHRPPTRKEYVRYVRKLAEHCQCDPATLTQNQVREYFLFLRQHKHYTRSPMKAAKFALRCFFQDCLQIGDWTVFSEVRVAEPQVLPIVLSRGEVAAVQGAVREARFRACLRLMYHCGLRVGEAVAIQVQDLHGRERPPRLHVRNGEGGKQRYVPLAPVMVEELRTWWRTHRNPQFLFPSPGRGWANRTLSLSQVMSQSTAPMSVSSVQMAFRLARAASGVNSAATTHSLRASVLHTWGRQLQYHPHVHCVVPAGGLRPDGLRWLWPPAPDFFLPYPVLAARFRNRLRQGLRQEHPEEFGRIPAQVWRQRWVVNVQPAGGGLGALKYLSAYVYRTALSNPRILADHDGQVTFGYRDSQDQQGCTLTLPALEFIGRFLQHVLPQGLARVRYYGWLSAAAKTRWERILALLDWQAPDPQPSTLNAQPPLCPHCGAPLSWIGTLERAPP